MDINDLKKMKKDSGMTNAKIAELSGIPLSTVNKIFSGATKNPRYATLLAIEQVLSSKEKIYKESALCHAAGDRAGAQFKGKDSV